MTVAAAELFAPELALGFYALDPELRGRLQLYLTDVLKARQFPVHTAVAWNALHFGFDTINRSYDEVLLGADMPTVELGGSSPALPIGALAWVHIGGKFGDVWAEVVGKDGRPDGVDDGVAPLRMAGRPADRQDAPVPGGDARKVVAVINEALICDFEAFGAMPDLAAALERLMHRGRLGPHRLVDVEAVYDPPEAAEDADLWFYARWLFDTQRHLLRAGPLGAGLENPTDEALRSALVASLTTVDLLLTSIPGVVRWGDYAMLAEWVDEIDLLPNLPLHQSDVRGLLHSMAYSRDGSPTATALAPRLEEKAGVPAPPPGPPDAKPVDLLDGLDYLRVVARTGRWLADRVDETGGVVAARGTKRLLRVDDRWPWGGIWRSEPWGPGHPLEGVPADEPLGLGWRGWVPLAEYLDRHVEDVVAAVGAALATPLVPEEPPGSEATGYDAEESGSDDATGDEPPVEDEPEEEPEEDVEEEPDDEVTSTLVEGHVSLRQVDVDTGALPLPERFAWLAGGGPVMIALSHAGDIDDDQRSQTAAAPAGDGIRRLESISWPLDFFAGIRLHCSAFAGGRTLFAGTVPLDGDAPFPFVFDPAIVGKPSPEIELTLAAVAVSVLARHGRQASDGTRRATAREVCVFCFGPGAPAPLVSAVAEALNSRIAVGRLELVGSEYALSPSGRVAPRRSAPTGWETTPLHREEVRAHNVSGFLRRLPWDWQASDRQRRLYEEDRAAGLAWGPPTLPDGFTYVPAFMRGSRDSVITEVLRRVVSRVDGRSPADDEIDDLMAVWEVG